MGVERRVEAATLAIERGLVAPLATGQVPRGRLRRNDPEAKLD
jgi:hypothetical protein